MFLVPPYPPSKIHPGSLPSSAFCPYPLSSFLLPPLRLFLCRWPSTPSSVCHPSSVCRKSTNTPADGRPKLPSPGVLPSVPERVCAPSPTCAAVGTWLGCGWRGKGDGAPCDGLELLDASTGVARDSVPPSTPEVPLQLSWCLSLCLPPPPLYPYNHTCPNTLPPNGRVF